MQKLPFSSIYRPEGGKRIKKGGINIDPPLQINRNAFIFIPLIGCKPAGLPLLKGKKSSYRQ